MQLAADLNILRHAQDLRETWQGRVLAAARGKLGMVTLSVLAHNFDDAMPVLLRVVFPGFVEPALPCLVSAGRVAKNGAIVADMMDRNGDKHLRAPIYKSELALRDDFRQLADDLKLSDEDREQLFIAVKNWVVADMRLDPSMDPKDPDAKRFVVH